MHIDIVKGDITCEQVDVIVNAANSTLLGGGGVDGAIHRAAGPELLAECRRIRETVLPKGLPVGQAVSTGGYDLPAKWVIHTVGPNAHKGETSASLLASCFRSCLRLAGQLTAKSIAFPAISAGTYGWAPQQVAQIAAEVIEERDARSRAAAAQGKPGDSLELIRFVLFADDVLAAFETAFGRGGFMNR